MTSSVMVNYVVLLSKTHIERSHYVLSFDVVQKKETESVKKKRKADEQVYIEHSCMVGTCSPETELPLQSGICEIEFVISGALEPTSPLEEGENMMEYNEKLDECSKLLNLKPTYQKSTDGNATIKFKVSDKVKHTVYIHDVPTEKYPPGGNFLRSSSSSFMSVRGAGTDRQFRIAGNSSCLSTGSAEEPFSGGDSDIEVCGSSSEDLYAVPIPPSELDEMSNLTIRNRGPLTDTSMKMEKNRPKAIAYRAYDLLLCNESLMNLSWSLSPADAIRLLIGLGVPNHVLEHNKKHHTGDVVACNYDGFLYWRKAGSSRSQEQEASTQQLYEDLLQELGDMERNDIKEKIKKALEENRKLEKKDFKYL